MLSDQIIIALLQLPGVGRRTVQKILSLNQFIPENLAECIQAAREERILTHDFLPFEIEDAWNKAQKMLWDCESAAVKPVSYQNAHYPPRLKNTIDFPVMLFVRGSTDAINSSLSIAVIGTREPTEYGLRAAMRLGELLTQNGAVIVSGLARGCDTEAHKGCLAANGQTVAVLAHGVDHIYPKENKNLADDIVSTGGCLVSEYPIGTKPMRNYFVERDRIQAGLSDGVMLIESDIKGGSMHTVKYALDYLRPVAALTGHPQQYLQSPKVEGNEFLIHKNKAIPFASKEDLPRFLSMVTRGANVAVSQGIVPENGRAVSAISKKRKSRKKKKEPSPHQISLNLPF